MAIAGAIPRRRPAPLGLAVDGVEVMAQKAHLGRFHRCFRSSLVSCMILISAVEMPNFREEMRGDTAMETQTRLRITDIFGVMDSLGDNQWETLEQYQLHGVEFSPYASPLETYLEKRFAGSNVDVKVVCAECPEQNGGPYNAVKFVDETYDIEVVYKMPYHVLFVEDYWQDMIESGPNQEDEIAYIERMQAEAADRDYEKEPF